jgi:transposase
VFYKYGRSSTQSREQRLREELERSLAKHEAVVAEYLLTLNEKTRQVESLERRIADLIRQLRGSRQERIDVDQLMLFSMEELQQIADELEQQCQEQTPAPDKESDSSDPVDPKPGEATGSESGRGGRRPLPKHLQREVRRHGFPTEALACPCCGETRQEFAVESSEQLEFVPGYWKVIQHDRVKYVCKACEEQGVVAPKPPQPIEKGLPGPGLAAHTTLSKFRDHTPLYRQEDIHSRIGWTVRRSTLCGWLFELAWSAKLSEWISRLSAGGCLLGLRRNLCTRRCFRSRVLGARAPILV